MALNGGKEPKKWSEIAAIRDISFSFDTTQVNGYVGIDPAYSVGGSWTTTGANILSASSVTPGNIQWNEWTATPCDDQHVLDGKSCEITPEGRFTGVCRECGITLILTRVPGGVDYLMVRDLMRYLMGGGDVEDVAGEILELQTALRQQQRAVEEGLELLEIAKRKLAQQAVAV